MPILRSFQLLFLGVFSIKRYVDRTSNFRSKSWSKPLKKCQFCGFLKPMFLLPRKVCFLCLKLFFSDLFSRSITWEYWRLKGATGVTRGYKGLQGVTGSNKGLQEVTRRDRGLQGVTGGFKRLQRIIDTFFNHNVPRYFFFVYFVL